MRHCLYASYSNTFRFTSFVGGIRGKHYGDSIAEFAMEKIAKDTYTWGGDDRCSYTII